MAGNMNTLCAVHTDIAGIGTVTYTATRALRIIDTNVLTSVAGGAGTVAVTNGGVGAITAFNCAAANDIIRAVTLDNTNDTVATGAALAVVAGGDATLAGSCIVTVLPTTWIAG